MGHDYTEILLIWAYSELHYEVFFLLFNKSCF